MSTDPGQTERNRRTITDAFHSWSAGTAPITDVFDPHMTWRIEGHSAASRAYADTEEFVAEVLAPFGRRFSADDPFRPVTRVVDGTAFYDSISFNRLWADVTPAGA
jgi:ketosteroid isomerase-like protein